MELHWIPHMIAKEKKK